MKISSTVKHFLSLLFFVGGYSLAHAQTDQQAYNLQKVIPPSPNASSLGKYVDWPVNLYTGVPQINVPVYEVKGRSLSVPISLSYHASGIKVSENASNVGLGWSLQAGGVITRSVRGLADDDSPVGYFSLRNYYTNPNDLSSGSIATGNSPFSDSALQKAVADGTLDSQPDLYMFSALGSSYKFYFSGTGTILTQPFSNLKITFNNSPQSSWNIIMEDGTKLLFGGSSNFNETTLTQQSLSVSDPFISAWYLQSITSTTGEVISFTYSSSGVVTTDSYVYESDYTLNMVEPIGVGLLPPTTTKVAKKVIQTSDINFLTPATIESELCRVYFDATARTDLPGSQAISGIRIYSKPQNKTIQSYLLNYTYSTATASNTYTGGYTTPLSRLKLNSLEEVPGDVTAPHKIWQFNYNPLSLPSRKSYAQDYWGYYNGATGNTTLKPFVINFNPDTYPFANRSADPASMMAEMLTKVTYPTGGYSQFTFEPNSYPANEEQFNSVPVNHSLFLTSGQSNFSNTTSTTFTITKPQYFKFQFTGTFSAVYLNDFGTTVTLASAVLKNSSNTTISLIGFQKPANASTTLPTTLNVTTSSVLLSPGTYTFTTSSISVQTDFGVSQQTVSLNSSFTYIGSLGVQLVNHPAGGVRIKGIAYFDNIDNTKSIVKNYTYAAANVIAPVDSAADFVTLTTDRTWDCVGTQGGGNLTLCGLPGCLVSSVIFYERNASSKFALGSIQGGTIGYSTVTESLGTNGANGKNIYNYSFVSNPNSTLASQFPYPPVTSLDYERGLLLDQGSYNAAGTLLSKSVNTYQFLNKGSVKAYKVAYKFNILSGCYVSTSTGYLLNRQFYQDETNQIKKLSTTQTMYDQNGLNPSTTVTNYFYDNPNNLSPVRTEVNDSKGNLVKTLSYTPLEKTDINTATPLTPTASAAIDTMVARNIISPVLQQQQFKAGVLQNLALTNYKNWTATLVLPENIQVKKTGNPLETRIRLNAYDNLGNLVEQQKDNDIVQSYIYGYNKNYPVAQIIGAGYSTIALLVNQTVLDNPLSTDAQIRTELNNLRTGLAATSALVTTYTFKPLVGITSQTDPNNRTTYYEYDAFNRLVLIRDKDNNILKKICYNYAGQPEACNFFGNIATSQAFTRNNCSVGFNGSSVTYTVAANTYKAASQSEADALAQANITANGQAYANTNGTCTAATTYSSVVKSGSFTRNNCASGFTGSTVTYTVAAGAYTSTVSQAAADQLAQNDVNNNGQTYANTNGTCTASCTNNITYNNFANVAGFSVTYTGTGGTTGTFTFTVPTSPSTGTLGCVPPGTYTISISKPGNTTNYSFDIGCALTTGTSASFTNRSSTTCNIVTIDTVL
jgi:YD repeat-containing protein